MEENLKSALPPHVLAQIPDPGQVFVALDTLDPEQAMAWVHALLPLGFKFKLGMALYYAAGPDFLRRLHGVGADVFVDLKLYDIPNTVRQAAQSLARAGAKYTNVHTQGGVDMMKAALEGAGEQVTIWGVTVLTSFANSVIQLADNAHQAGLAGVVCSAHEAKALRHQFGEGFERITPGIRFTGSDLNDQARVMTPSVALHAGASYLVIGRPITGLLKPEPLPTTGCIAAEHN
jgi:orotidine-5'-phosphate decarboxylase